MMGPRQYLESRVLHGIKLGLDNIRAILDAAGNPEAAFPAIHVGGTNGKGSVVAILDAMLGAAGYRTGRFTSPHLIHLNERFLVNRTPISDDDLDAHIVYFQKLAESDNLEPTFFELNTAIAYRHFRQEQIEVGLIEVGLGGRFDSTNTLNPELSIITNIDLDHTEYLGETLEEIAFEKAGILKPGVPFVLGETRPGPQNVILDRAREVGTSGNVLAKDFDVEVSGPIDQQSLTFTSAEARIVEATLGLPGRYQANNAALAIAAALELRPRFSKLDERAICAGLAEARWPCRLETLLDSPRVVVDVAHNAAGARQLSASLPDECVLVLAASSDKDARGMIAALAPVARPLILTSFDHSRAMPAEALGALADGHEHEVVSPLDKAIARGMGLANQTTPLVITGSIFAAGEARDILTREYGAEPIAF